MEGLCRDCTRTCPKRSRAKRTKAASVAGISRDMLILASAGTCLLHKEMKNRGTSSFLGFYA